MPRDTVTITPYESEAPSITYEARPYYEWLLSSLSQVLGAAPELGAVTPSPQAIWTQATAAFPWLESQVTGLSPYALTTMRWMYERPEEEQLVTHALRALQSTTIPELANLQTYIPEIIRALGQPLRTPQIGAFRDIGLGYADYLNRLATAVQEVAQRGAFAPTEVLRETPVGAQALREAVGAGSLGGRIAQALGEVPTGLTAEERFAAEAARALATPPTLETLRELDPLVQALRERWQQTLDDLLARYRQSAIARGLGEHGGTAVGEQELLRRAGTEWQAQLAQILGQRLGQREAMLPQGISALLQLGTAARQAPLQAMQAMMYPAVTQAQMEMQQRQALASALAQALGAQMQAYSQAAALGQAAAPMATQAFALPWQVYQQQIGQELGRMMPAAQLVMGLAGQQFAQQQALAGLGLQAAQAYQQYLQRALGTEMTYRQQQLQNWWNLLNWLYQTQAQQFMPALQALLGLTGVRATYGVPAAPPAQLQTAIAPWILFALAGGM